MRNSLTPIDISTMPELMRIAEEVATTNKARALKREDETVAILIPPSAKAKLQKKRVITSAEYEAFRNAAGSWSDADIEQFKADLYTSRKRGSRTPIKL